MVTTRSNRRKEEPRDKDFRETSSKRVKTDNNPSQARTYDSKNISRTLTDPHWRQKSNNYDEDGKCLSKNDFTYQVNNFVVGSNNFLLMNQKRKCRNANLANIRPGTDYRATINLEKREELFDKLKKFSLVDKMIDEEEKKKQEQEQAAAQQTSSSNTPGANTTPIPLDTQNSDNSNTSTSEFSEIESVSDCQETRPFDPKLPAIQPIVLNQHKYMKNLTERKSLMIDNQIELSPRPKNSDGVGVTPAKSTYCVAYSPCGKYSAIACAPHFMTIINIYEKRIEKYYRQSSLMSRSPWSLSWHQNFPNLVASACLNGEVRIWDIDSKKGEATGETEDENMDVEDDNSGYALTKLKKNSNTRICCDFHPRKKLLLIVQGELITLWNFGNDKNPEDIVQYKLDNSWQGLYCKFDKRNPEAFYLAVDQASPKPSSLGGKNSTSGPTRRYTPSELVHHRPSGGQNQTPLVQRMRIQAIQQAMNLSAANAGAGEHNPVLQQPNNLPNPNTNIRSPSGMVQTMRMPTTSSIYYVEFEKLEKTRENNEDRPRKTSGKSSTVKKEIGTVKKDRNGRINEKGIFKVVSEPANKKARSQIKRSDESIKDLPANVFVSKVSRNVVILNQHSCEISPCGKYIAMICQIVKQDPRTYDKGCGLKPGPFNPETEPERIAGNIGHGCPDPHYNEDPNSGNPNNNVTNPNAPNSGQTVDQVYANNATGGIFPLAHGGTALVWDNLPMPSPAIETPRCIRRIEYNNQLAIQGKEPEELIIVVRVFSTTMNSKGDFPLLYQIKADQSVSVSWSPTSNYRK